MRSPSLICTYGADAGVVQAARQLACGIDIHIEVSRVEQDPVGAGRTIDSGGTEGKLADDRLGEPSINKGNTAQVTKTDVLCVCEATAVPVCARCGANQQFTDCGLVG